MGGERKAAICRVCKWHLCVLITTPPPFCWCSICSSGNSIDSWGWNCGASEAFCLLLAYVLLVSLSILAYITYAGISLPSRLSRYLPEMSSIRSGLFIITRSRILPLQSCAKQRCQLRTFLRGISRAQSRESGLRGGGALEK